MLLQRIGSFTAFLLFIVLFAAGGVIWYGFMWYYHRLAAANQVCYAFLLGLVFGYVYIRTGRLRYSMILHVIINTMTSIILPALLILVEGSLSGISPSQVQLVSVITHPGVLALLLYVAGLFVLFLFGAVVFFFGVREREVSPDGVRMKTVFSSWGIILFLVITIIALL